MAFGTQMSDELATAVRKRHPNARLVVFWDSDHCIGHWTSAEVIEEDDSRTQYSRRSKFGKLLFEEADDALSAFTDKAFLDL